MADRQLHLRYLFQNVSFEEVNFVEVVGSHCGRVSRYSWSSSVTQHKIKVFLRLCAEFQGGVGEELRCRQPTMSRIFYELLERGEMGGEWFRLPTTEN